MVTVIALLAAMAGCGNSTDDNQLVAVDSLLAQNRGEEAMQTLKVLNTSSFNHNDKAYYALLTAQANHACHIAATSDNDINEAVKYFKAHGNKEKYARALLYQGCVNKDLGHLEKAIACLRQAEDVASADDLKNRAMAKMTMGELYQSQVIGAKTLGAAKYREALTLFKEMDDRYHQLICLSELGGLYRINKEKEDSALIYINEAIDLAKKEIEPQYVMANLFSRAEYRAARGDYQGAKDDAVDAISWSGNIKIHPRIHYVAASAYMNLGRIDSARYYLQHAPEMTSAADSIMHYQLLANLARRENKVDEAIDYLNLTHNLADSVAMSGMYDKLLEAEKKYDIQQAALENALLSSRLRGTLLGLALLLLTAGALAFLLWRYRNRLKIQQTEYELQKADLDQSIASLHNMQETIKDYEKSLKAAQAEYQGNEARMSDAITALEEKKKQSDELKSIVDNQIQVVHQLLQWSYECNETTFAKRFNKLMTMRGPDEVGASYWDNLQALANELYDNVLVKAQKAADGTLREDEINLIALHCHGFSRTVIMICMRYRNMRTVSNKKIQIAHKLHVNTLDEFLQPFLKRRTDMTE
jgi:tetratricopeptide (TPR) repeat protein